MYNRLWYCSLSLSLSLSLYDIIILMNTFVQSNLCHYAYATHGGMHV